MEWLFVVFPLFVIIFMTVILCFFVVVIVLAVMKGRTAGRQARPFPNGQPYQRDPASYDAMLSDPPPSVFEQHQRDHQAAMHRHQMDHQAAMHQHQLDQQAAMHHHDPGSFDVGGHHGH